MREKPFFYEIRSDTAVIEIPVNENVNITEIPLMIFNPV
jgi:hypothetical protein